MKKLFAFFTLALLSMLAVAQQAQVSTGDPQGTYALMFQDMGKYCGSRIALVPTPSTGSVENIDRLIGNQVNAAFVQADVLYRRAQIEDLGDVKTLLALHPEVVHFIVPQVSGLKTGGVMGVFGSAVVLTDITQLAGLRVGAAGGSEVTAKEIKLQTDIPYVVVPFKTNADALAALQDGKINAVVMVGGAPLPSVSKLPPGVFKLLAVPPVVAEKMKSAYRPARVSYRNLDAAAVPTVGTDALLVVRNYKTPKMVAALTAFRQCLLESLDTIKETTGTDSNWRTVRAENRGTWPYYEGQAK